MDQKVERMASKEGEVMADEKTVLELERLLATVNSNLNLILPSIEKNPDSDPAVLKLLKETENLSRWKRTPVPGHPESYDYAVTRAKMKASLSGEPFVVADDGSSKIVVVSKARLLKEKPFGLTEKNIIFETGKAMA